MAAEWRRPPAYMRNAYMRGVQSILHQCLDVNWPHSMPYFCYRPVESSVWRRKLRCTREPCAPCIKAAICCRGIPVRIQSLLHPLSICSWQCS